VSIETIIYCVGGVNGDEPTEVTRYDIDTVTRFLLDYYTDNYTETDDGIFKHIRVTLLAHIPFALHQNIELVYEFIPRDKYPKQIGLYKNEIGAVGNMRIVLTEETKIAKEKSVLGNPVYVIVCEFFYPDDDKKILFTVHLYTTRCPRYQTHRKLRNEVNKRYKRHNWKPRITD